MHTPGGKNVLGKEEYIHRRYTKWNYEKKKNFLILCTLWLVYSLVQAYADGIDCVLDRSLSCYASERSIFWASHEEDTPWHNTNK